MRRYGAALVLTAAVLGAPPAGRAAGGPALVRLVGRTAGGFDPREVVGPGVVLTVPLEAGGGGSEGTAGPSAN